MNQSPPTFKCFEPRPGHTPCRLPPLVEQLAGGLALPGYFDLRDLREMSKFREIPNVHGLAAYPIERAAPVGFDPAEPARAGGGGTAAIAPIPELPAGVARPLADTLTAEPLVLVQGTLPLGRPEPMAVQAIVPQTHAHLAAALRLMLHPWPEVAAGEGPRAADYTLLIWPGPLVSRRGRRVLEAFIGHWPASARVGAQGVGLTVGCDDPGLAARLLLDAARRRLVGEGGGTWIDLGGEVPLVVAGNRERALWASPLRSAADLAGTPDGRRRALGVGSWLIGVESDGEGHFPLLELGAEAEDTGDGGGWILIAPGSSDCG